MIESSEVFSAMLAGHFAEAEQTEVTLAKVGVHAVQVLLDCIEGRTEKIEQFSQEQTTKNIDTMLHLLELSHQYMIKDLFTKTLNTISSRLLSRSSLERIMTFSQSQNLPELACACGQYVLWSDDLTDNEREEIVLYSMSDERKESFIDVLEEILTKAVEQMAVNS